MWTLEYHGDCVSWSGKKMVARTVTSRNAWSQQILRLPRGVVGRGQGGLRCHLGLPYETQGNRGEQFFLVDMHSIWQEEELIDTIEATLPSGDCYDACA
ncbi:hypothetical protein OPV22_027731 [Ensete ventricosum]|uniref:Uncharacterized protein n=1 Tax=Ensete ventricosum TaxID=4639 RepID=A0AAV8Q106_ENSVE|nr:hypothetical protein OPV22_027731 [Ensete ventricosum]